MRQTYLPILLGSLLICGCERTAEAPAEQPAQRQPSSVRYPQTRETVEALARAAMATHEVTGVSLALVDGQEIVWATGFGYADLRRGTRADEHTLYSAGSIAKVLVVLATLRLAEQGRLDLDAPLSTIFPEFSVTSRFPAAEPITPRHILAHHSGLPSDRLRGTWDPTPTPWTDLVHELRGEPVPYPPGHVTAYSNLGYTLLGHAIQIVTGEDFTTYMRKNVLVPAGMRTASFERPAPGDRVARGHRLGQPANEPALRLVPAGGLWASVLDLAEIIRLTFAKGRGPGGQIVGRASIDEMLRPQNADMPLDLDLRMGLSWMLTRVELAYAGKVAWHASWTPHFHGQIMLLPEHELGVVVLSNSMTGAAVVDPLAIETLQSALMEKLGIEIPDPAGDPLPARGIADATTLRAHVGRYATDQSTLTVSLGGRGLRTESLAGTAELVPLVDGTFDVLGLPGLRVSFERIQGRDLMVTRQAGVRGYLAQKIETTPIPAAWRERLGALEITNAGDDWLVLEEPHLREDDGLLILGYDFVLLHPPVPVSMVLDPIASDEARIVGLGRGKGETIRVVRGPEGDTIRWSGYDFRPLR